MIAGNYVATFGDALRAVRRAKGLSQDELGEMMNVSNGTISNWETGKTHYVTQETRRQLAFKLGQPQDYFANLVFGDQFAKENGVVDFSAELIAAADKLGIADEVRVITSYENLPKHPERRDVHNLLSHNEAEHRASSPHNGVYHDGTIRSIDGVQTQDADVQYVVRTIQQIYSYWLYNPQKSGAHWWFFLADALLHVTTTDDFKKLRQIIPQIDQETPIRPSQNGRGVSPAQSRPIQRVTRPDDI